MVGYVANCERKTIKIIGMSGFSQDRALYNYANPKVPQLEQAYADHHRDLACSGRINSAYARVRPVGMPEVFSYADYVMRDHALRAPDNAR